MTKQRDAYPKSISIDPALIVANEWNPNRMDEATFQKEVRSIQDHGFIDPVTLREAERGGEWVYEIVDGEHRWKAAKHLALKSIIAVNLGPIDDAKAKKLTILFNDLRGQSEPALLAKLLKDLAEDTPIAQLADELPMTSVEIDTLIKSTDVFEWKSDEELTSGVSDEGRAPSTVDDAERKFQIGTVRGVLPEWLTKELSTEFQRSAKAVRSKNPELVMRDWLARLKATMPTVPEAPPTPAPAAASVPPPAPAKKRRGRKATEEPAARSGAEE